MSIETVCQKNVITLQEGATLAQAATLMHESHVGSVVIVEEKDTAFYPVGILTDRDIALALAAYPDARLREVRQFMRRHLVCVNKSEGVFEATVMMRDFGVRRMPVVNADGSLFGIISADDLLGLIAEEALNLSKSTAMQRVNEADAGMPLSMQFWFQ